MIVSSKDRLSDLIKKLKTKLALFASIFLFLMILNMILSSYLNNKTDELGSLEVQLNNSKVNYIKQEENIKKLQNAKKVWDQINKIRENRNNLNLDKVKTIINILNQDRWLVKKIDINIGNPTEIAIPGFTEISSTINPITISFSTVSDKIVFNTLKKLDKNFPGFVIYKSVHITKLSDINPDLLNKLSQGVLPELIQCQIEFDWQNLKDLKQDAAKK